MNMGIFKTQMIETNEIVNTRVIKYELGYIIRRTVLLSDVSDLKDDYHIIRKYKDKYYCSQTMAFTQKSFNTINLIILKMEKLI